MPLSRKEIRNNAHAFAKEWQGERREHAEAKPFWEAFFQVFGISRRRVASFEAPVKKLGANTGFIDLLWPGKLLIEHKSYGKNLDKAYQQGLSYFVGLKEAELPRYVLVSDFERFKLYDLESSSSHSFTLAELPDNVHLFDFIAGYEDIGNSIQEIDLNIQAAELLGKFHDALANSGYSGHALEIFLVRVLFCLFAEDTGIFSRHQFINYLLNYTKEDGSDTEMHLAKLFQVLDSPDNARNKNLSTDLNAFPYVNGHLFAERIDMPSFDHAMRDELMECAYFDWSTISPAIFGSLFQSVMSKQSRRNLGAHYTSERDILRLIKPLFLDDLQQEFERIKKLKGGAQKTGNSKQQQLINFQQHLSQLHFLDPACGCGNFLIITYRELRRLELAILQEQSHGNMHSLIGIEPLIRLDCFHGIEIEEWPVRIAEVAMWLTQHQMNREFAKQFGHEPDLLPLKTAAHIVQANALRTDWQEIVPMEKLNYIMGNPPFIGKNFRNAAQNADMDITFKMVKNYKSLDFVACWFAKAAQLMRNGKIQAAFVSTNSITMGEQVAPLWQPLLDIGITLNFAHRTFAWASEARGKAAVHVVVIGFAYADSPRKWLFEYPDIKGEPLIKEAKQISPYLLDAPPVIIDNRTQPLCSVSPLVYGNKPVDGGHLLLSSEERTELLRKEPQAERWLRPLLGAEEFINGKERWCLWLVDIQPNELKAMPEVMKRIAAVKKFRAESSKQQTVELANVAYLFAENRQPLSGYYILIPRVSSERREYVPMGFLDNHIISTDLNNMIPNATRYEFGVLESKMHMTWMRAVAGRLKSDYRYSAKLVYNNFPWPEADDKQQQTIAAAAQAILDIRLNYPNSTLADLYDPLTMPAPLRKAHTHCDKLVEQAYRTAPFKDDAERIQFLFERYRGLAGEKTRKN